MSEKIGDNVELVGMAEAVGKAEFGYPIIRKCVSAHNFEQYAEQIIDYCDTLDEPLFIEMDGKLDTVMVSARYYKKMGYDIIDPLPSEEEIAVALAEGGAEL